MYVDWQTIITAAAVIAAVVAFGTYFAKVHNWVLQQNKQDNDISGIKRELQITTYGLLACLKGLAEQGCDGPVREAIVKIEEHLNAKAHR